MNHIRHFLFGTVCLISTAASAQWKCTDKDGRKVFSDRAPPPDILEQNILKRPAGRNSNATTAVSPETAIAPAAAATTPQATTNAPKLSGIEKELADKKKLAEEAAIAKRKNEEERVLKVKIENCARAKQAKASFDSGTRIGRINAKGEREIMDDAARAAETQRIQSIMNADCQ
jgi:hypothetical protein